MVGALAQLGEHLLCKQGVIGSIPISSTNREAIGVVLSSRCRNPSDCFAADCARHEARRTIVLYGLTDLSVSKKYPFEEIKSLHHL